MSLSADDDRGGAYWVGFALEQIGYGVALGAAIGSVTIVLLRWTRRNGWSDGRYEQIATFAVPIIALAGAEVIGGNGFIAAFLAGLTFGAVRPRGVSSVQAANESEHLAEFTEDAAQLLGVAAFFVFGNLFVGDALGELGPTEFVAALLSLTLVRMVPVWLSFLGAGLRLPTKLFVGWFGPRGLASIAFGILLLEDIEDMGPGLDQIVGVITITVTASVVLHGATAAPGAARYGRWAAHVEMDDAERREMEMADLDTERVPRVRFGERS